jgi:hypothetical protein
VIDVCTRLGMNLLLEEVQIRAKALVLLHELLDPGQNLLVGVLR